jgi:hypothetical protein
MRVVRLIIQIVRILGGSLLEWTDEDEDLEPWNLNRTQSDSLYGFDAPTIYSIPSPNLLNPNPDVNVESTLALLPICECV